MASTAEGEFRIKSRGVVRELGAILSFKELLNPFKHPMLSWVLFSHRLLRWSVSLFLIALFLINLNLSENSFYMTFLWMQVVFCLMSLCGLFIRRNIKIISLPFYFSLVNTAALWGIVKFLRGQRQSTWNPIR